MAHLGLQNAHLHPPRFAVGTVLDGKYRIERVLAQGGVAIVVQATQLQLDRSVAIKVLRAEALQHPEIIEHFQREGTLASKIKSEHVVRIHDVGLWQGIGPYMVMELLEGGDLQNRLDNGALAVDESVGLMLQACDALAEAHALRIVHRDLKPANLFLAERPGRASILKVIDFGISKEATRDESSFNGNGGNLFGPSEETSGTPAYMSPEQIRGEVVDARADIWALGVVLFEMLTGTVPFAQQATPERLLKLICEGTPTRLSALRADVPPGLEAVIAKCLARNPIDRFATVGELAQELRPFAPIALSSIGKDSGSIQFPIDEQSISRRIADPRRHAPTMVVGGRASTASRITILLAVLAALAVMGLVLIIVAFLRKPGMKASAVPMTTTTTSNVTVSAPTIASVNVSASASAPTDTAPTIEVATAAASASASAASSAKPTRPVLKGNTNPAPTPTNGRSMFGERK